MKKIISILVIVFAFAFTTQAQRKGGKMSVDKILTKMTTDLNLSTTQQNSIKPLLVAQIEDRQAMMKKRMEMRENGVKPSKEERQEAQEERTLKETAFNEKMKTILTDEQFEIFLENKEAKKQKNRNRKERE